MTGVRALGKPVDLAVKSTEIQGVFAPRRTRRRPPHRVQPLIHRCTPMLAKYPNVIAGVHFRCPKKV